MLFTKHYFIKSFQDFHTGISVYKSPHSSTCSVEFYLFRNLQPVLLEYSVNWLCEVTGGKRWSSDHISNLIDEYNIFNNILRPVGRLSLQCTVSSFARWKTAS